MAQRKTSRCIEHLICRSAQDEQGQATLEAALLIPSIMLLFALLLQPACLLYTRAVMQGAAAECARIAATASTSDEEACRNYALRRLKAVPEVSPFHVGGDGDWDVLLNYTDGGTTVEVTIVGHARPLPLMGVVASSFGKSEGGLVVLEAQVSERVRPLWFGGSYDTWMQVWGS